MSRPQGGQSGGSAANSSPSGNRIDALICARSGSTIERQFAAAELPRLREAGVGDETAVTTRLHFSQFDGHVVIEGQNAMGKPQGEWRWLDKDGKVVRTESR